VVRNVGHAPDSSGMPAKKGSVRALFVSARAVALAALLTLPFPSDASCDSDPECGDPTAWSGFTRVVLKQSSPGSKASAHWIASFDHKVGDVSMVGLIK